MWKAFVEYDPGKVDTVFNLEATDQMVVVTGMRVWTLCEHHLLPFWADISIGYIASGKVLGLSKFGRIAHKHAHRLQIQERLISGIADELSSILESDDIAVLAEGEHLCMTMRGIQTPARMKSSVMRGTFRENPQARAEFLSLCK
jgi:GTP cyclohydrolase I